MEAISAPLERVSQGLNPRSPSPTKKRNLPVQVAAASLDSKSYNSSYYKCSALLDLSLDSGEEKPVLQQDRTVAFPLSVSVMAEVACSLLSNSYFLQKTIGR